MQLKPCLLNFLRVKASILLKMGLFFFFFFLMFRPQSEHTALCWESLWRTWSYCASMFALDQSLMLRSDLGLHVTSDKLWQALSWWGNSKLRGIISVFYCDHLSTLCTLSLCIGRGWDIHRDNSGNRMQSIVAWSLAAGQQHTATMNSVQRQKQAAGGKPVPEPDTSS